MFRIDRDYHADKTGIDWIDRYFENNDFPILDLFAKWGYEAAVNYDRTPMPIGGVYVYPQFKNSGGEYAYSVELWINELFDEAVNHWERIDSDKYSSDYTKEFINDLGVFFRGSMVNQDGRALIAYPCELYGCKSDSELSVFLKNLDQVCKRRYPEGTNVRVSIPQASSSGGCYIATAVYGSYDCPEVWTLRRFRDDALLRTNLGRLFVKTYYAVSPTIVKVFGKKDSFNRFWRKRLDRWVDDLNRKGYEDTPYYDK